jgi:hypothetical protein
MKSILISLIITAIFIAGCSSTSQINSEVPLRNQKLSTSFVSEGIKIETDCSWYKFGKSECDVTAIESNASAWINGTSSAQIGEARKVARMEASANVAHFLNEKITSNRVISVMAKHFEKANDQTVSDSSVMSDKEAQAITNSNRENANDTARTVTRSISANAEAILKGFKTVKEEPVGQQEISVTIRWDLESDRAASQLRNRFK